MMITSYIVIISDEVFPSALGKSYAPKFKLYNSKIDVKSYKNESATYDLFFCNKIKLQQPRENSRELLIIYCYAISRDSYF